MYLQKYFKLFLYATLLFFTYSVDAQSGNDQIEYCNDRFDFCLKYPSQVFIQKNISTNEDGLVLRSHDDDLRLRVYGYHNILDNDASSELDNYIEMVQLDHPNVELDLIEEKRDAKNAFAILKVGRLHYFVRTVYKGKDMVGLTLEINRTKASDIETAMQLTEKLIRQISL
jgi:hypothetical protein